MKIFYTIILIIAALLIYTIVTSLSHQSDLRNITTSHTIGNLDAPYRLTEFLDYNCQYCAKIHPTIKELLQQRDDILYIPRPVAASSNLESIKKASLSYAAAEQGKLADIQSELFSYNDPIDQDYVNDLAARYDMNKEKLLQDMTGDQTKTLIQNNHSLFLNLKLQGTPTFIVNEKIFFIPTQEMPSVKDLNALLDEAAL